MRTAPISAALTVLLTAAWYIVALALALTTWFAAVSVFLFPFHSTWMRERSA